MRPEDAPDASAAESISVLATKPPSKTDETSADHIMEDNAVTDVLSESLDEPDIAPASSDERIESPAISKETTDNLPKDSKPLDISWGEEADATWDIHTQNPFEREDVVARTNSVPSMETAAEHVDEVVSVEPAVPQTYEDLQTGQQEDTILASEQDTSQNNSN
ncbi:hypothetical protein F66182_17135, partial [Fusarium sp. NRRL 66182]